MENLLECNICLEKYDIRDKVPRILKCGHTFCTKCLKEITRVNCNNQSLPFVKCPIDKIIGHNNTNIEEVPINRIIVDILEYNGFNFEKLSLKDEKNEKLAYINSAIDKLKEFDKYSTANYNLIRDNILKLMNGKNKAIAEISNHYDKIISIIEHQKASSIYQIEKYTNDKLGVYNEVMQTIEKYREMAAYKLSNLEIVKNQKVNNMSIADEINVIHSLGIDQMDSKGYESEVNGIIKEMEAEFIPIVAIKTEIDEQLIEIINSTKVIIPNTKESSYNTEEIYSLNEDLEHLNIDNTSLFWFQQNTNKVYRKHVNEPEWIRADNKDNYIFNEMYRVCIISPEEALLTGGAQNFVCSTNTVLYSKGYFKKKPNMLVERRSHAVCKAGDFVYVCGGINSKGDSIPNCEKFSLTYEKWLKVANMVFAKSHHSICSVNNQYIFSIGGENKCQSLLDVIEKYSIQFDKWEVLSVKLPNKIECCACLQNKNEILIFGGYNVELGSLKSVLRFDFVKNTIRNADKEMSDSGWSINQPFKRGNTIHILYGGEEGFPPSHFFYQLE